MYKILLSVLIAVILLSFPGAIYARSGCCSHHGGVCGCGCCDGTSLSSTCAPYYPQCNPPFPRPTFYASPKPILRVSPIPTYKPTTTQTTATQQTNLVNNTDSTKNDDGNTLTGIVIGLAGVGVYSWFKNRKND